MSDFIFHMSWKIEMNSPSSHELVCLISALEAIHNRYWQSCQIFTVKYLTMCLYIKFSLKLFRNYRITKLSLIYHFNRISSPKANYKYIEFIKDIVALGNIFNLLINLRIYLYNTLLIYVGSWEIVIFNGRSVNFHLLL